MRKAACRTRYASSSPSARAPAPRLRHTRSKRHQSRCPARTSTEGATMIARLIALCVHNRLLVLLLTAVVVGLGIWSTFSIGLDAIPDLSDVQVIVVTEYPGQNPEVVNNQVTYPLTTAMLSVP